jgi:GNAT superfamily N-acetyltransferase
MKIVLLTSDNWILQSLLVEELAAAYAIDFWAGTWKELLAIRDEAGNVVEQFGTWDEYHVTYPETAELLRSVGEQPVNIYGRRTCTHSAWPKRVWTLACEGKFVTPDGRKVEPYWSLDQAREELKMFVMPIEQGGYGGEILVLSDSSVVLGFTAYTCHPGDLGRELARKRFSSSRLCVPLTSTSPTVMSVKDLLESYEPGNVRFGIFLDHAVSESVRGNGYGSKLFDVRLERLVELGANVLFGRTMLTATRQYRGNYLARGLTPIAADGTDEFSRAKHYFAVRVNELKPRLKF